MNEETDSSTKEESISKMKIFLYNLKKKDMNNGYPILGELRNHLLLLHETLFDSLKRLSTAESDLFQAEVLICKSVVLTDSVEKLEEDS